MVILTGLSLLSAGDSGPLYLRALELFENRHLAAENAVKAKEIAEQIIISEPENAKALVLLSRYHLFAGAGQKTSEEKLSQYEKGRELAEKAEKLDATSADAAFYFAANLGRTAELKGIFNALGIAAEVKKGMERALQKDKNHPLAKVALANYYYRVPGLFGGNTEKAVELLKESLETHPDLTMAYVDLARIYKGLGKKKEALDLLEKVVKKENPYPKANYYLYDKRDAEELLKELLR